MKACPPQPGWTVITSSRSMLSRNGSTAAAGVSGLSAIPGDRPLARMALITASGSSSASTWKTIRSLPASAKADAYRCGSEIIKWLCTGTVACSRIASTTSGPMVMFFTKCPSITSTWTESTPPSTARRTSSPSRAKSAFSRLALMCGSFTPPTPHRSGPARAPAAFDRRAAHGAARRRPRSGGRACPAR